MSTNKNLPSTTTMPNKAAGEKGSGFPTTYKEENNRVKEAVEDLLDVAPKFAVAPAQSHPSFFRTNFK